MPRALRSRKLTNDDEDSEEKLAAPEKEKRLSGAPQRVAVAVPVVDAAEADDKATKGRLSGGAERVPVEELAPVVVVEEKNPVSDLGGAVDVDEVDDEMAPKQKIEKPEEVPFVPKTELQRRRLEAQTAFSGGLGDVLSKATKKRSRFDTGERDGEVKESEGRVGPVTKTAKQRAVEEAMASFGGGGLDSVLVKPSNAASGLESLPAVGPGAAFHFKDEAVEGEGEGEPHTQAPQRQLSRLERAKMEAQTAFSGGLGDVLSKATKKRSRFDTGERDGEEKTNDMTESPSEPAKKTAKQRAVEEAMASFGGGGLDSVLVKPKKETESETETQTGPVVVQEKQMSRLERAKLEAQAAFGGGGLGDVMKQAKKKKSRFDTGEVEEEKEEEEK